MASAHPLPQDHTLEFAPARRLSPIRVLAAALAVVLFLALPVEGCLRVIEWRYNLHGLRGTQDDWFHVTEPSPGELFRMRAGNHASYGFRINSLGYRGPEFPPHTPAVPRIAALGDSTVFGLWVEESQAWPEQLRGLLSQRMGLPVEVLNMGRVTVSSHSTLHDVRTVIPNLKPDALVVSLANWNDFQIFHEAPTLDERRAVAIDLFGPYVADLPRVKALSHSAIYRAWRRTYWGRIGRKNERLTAEWLASGLYSRSGVEHPRRVSPEHFRENLTAIVAEARRMGIPVFLTTPWLRPSDQTDYGIQEVYAEIIREVASGGGAYLIDTRPVIGAEPSYFVDNVHLSVPGNARVAAMLADSIAAHWSEVNR